MNQRPRIHFTSHKNWLNDPNGFSKIEDTYHLFYQYNPYGVKWGNMSWGHATSHDLMHWKHLPIAMTGDQDYDKEGVFSGTVFYEEGNIHLYYTGVANPPGKPHGPWISTQCHATTEDGVTYIKDPDNPIVEPDPRYTDAHDFRDPKVFKKDQDYFMLVAAGYKRKGRMVLLRSKDRIEWEWFTLIEKEDTGYMWECPDLFEIGGKDHIILSTMGTGGPEFPNEVLIGSCQVNYESGESSLGDLNILDYGKTMYAPQTMANQTDPIVFIGWLMMKEPFTDHEWTGIMIFPREIYHDALGYRYDVAGSIRQAFSKTLPTRMTNEPVPLPEIFRLKLEIKCQEDFSFAILDRCDEDWDMGVDHINLEKSYGLTFSYSKEDSTLAITRETSSLGDKALKESANTYSIVHREEVMDLIIYVDVCVVEIFINKGRKVVSTLVPKEKKENWLMMDQQSQLISQIQVDTISEKFTGEVST